MGGEQGLQRSLQVNCCSAHVHMYTLNTVHTYTGLQFKCTVHKPFTSITYSSDEPLIAASEVEYLLKESGVIKLEGWIKVRNNDSGQ